MIASTRRVSPFGFADVARLLGWLLRQPQYHPYYFPPLPIAKEEAVLHELLETHANIFDPCFFYGYYFDHWKPLFQSKFMQLKLLSSSL